MSDEPDQQPDGVLRPFTPPEVEPLPPVQASSVVVPEVTPEPEPEPEPTPPPPAPPEATAAEPEIGAVDAPEPEADAPGDGDAFWSPEGDQAGDPFGLEIAAGVTDAIEVPAPADDTSMVELDTEDTPPAAEPAPAEPADDEPTDDDAPVAAATAAGAGVLPTAGSGNDEITLPRTPFLIGVGVAALALLALFFLWQSAGGDDGPTVAEDPTTTEAAEPTDDEDDADPAVDDAAAQAEADAATISGLEDTVADQEETISGLEAELAATLPPALRGEEMRRIVVAADASFVSVGSESVAVIGPFGGYAAIDPATNAVTAAGQVASGATRVMRTSAAVWITNYADSQIVRIDPITSTVVGAFEFPGPDGVAKLGGTLAVASFDGGFVAQVDPSEESITRQVDVGGSPTEVFVLEDESALWVAVFDTGEVVRIDAESFDITARVTVGSGPVGLSADDGTLWVVNHAEGTVVGVDLETEEVVSNYAVGAGPTAALAFAGSLWVTVTDAGELVQLDPATGETITRTPLGSSNRGGPTGLAVGNDSLWVAMQGERSVVRITPVEG